MKFEATSKNTIVISLTSQDLQELGITYQEMDYNNLETRRVIYTLLQKASIMLDKDIHPSGKMLIEAIPDAFGGCILYFTVFQSDADKEEVVPSATPFVCVCEFADENDLIDVCRSIMSSFLRSPESKLYSNGRTYRMIFTGYSNQRKLKSILSEYCNNMSESKTKVAQTREHWKCLCDTNAVEIVGSN